MIQGEFRPSTTSKLSPLAEAGPGSNLFSRTGFYPTPRRIVRGQFCLDLAAGGDLHLLYGALFPSEPDHRLIAACWKFQFKSSLPVASGQHPPLWRVLRTDRDIDLPRRPALTPGHLCLQLSDGRLLVHQHHIPQLVVAISRPVENPAGLTLVLVDQGQAKTQDDRSRFGDVLR